ncbi:MAG TPA: DNA methyltransferase [Tepidisphaeraceae bacterium]
MSVVDSTEAAERIVEKWSAADLSERAASQEHFIDLCRLLGQPTPAEADPTGKDYCFEKPVKVTQAASKGSKGEGGFVDVWKRGFFAWEYKRKDKYKTLDEAYRQLYQYRDALDNPPLSVVCDIRTTEIRSHFPGYPTAKVVIRLEEIPGRLEVLRRVFTAPESFRPAKKTEEVTLDLANEFGKLADRLIERYPPGDLHLFQHVGDPVAHFLMKVMFCLFAEDITLLPAKTFTKLVERSQTDPDKFAERCATLFARMRTGGEYGSDEIPYFNGGLFDDKPPIPLTSGDLTILRWVAERDWSGVEPSIFGTLFERLLDPRKRAQIGAHYTSRHDILLAVEPVVMAPLRRTWTELQAKLAEPLAAHAAERDPRKRDFLAAPIRIAIEGFRQYLARQRILDPACGSGNFLYVALRQLLDLEDEAVRFAAIHDINVNPTPHVRPAQLHGIEINPYAAELAQVVIWIGYLQWLHDRGIDPPNRPILDKLQNIEQRDAILDLSDKNKPVPAQWPEADFIIGNPPFLGNKLFRQNGLSDTYISSLYKAFNLNRNADLCCYWFENGRAAVESLRRARVGLLATQAIRGLDTREVLERIKETGDIFMAWSDRDWVLDGANVHVSIVGFDGGDETQRFLDGVAVKNNNPDLTTGVNTTLAAPLAENRNVCFVGGMKKGRFDLSNDAARQMLSGGGNPNGRPDSDVIVPWINGQDVAQRERGAWIIDFNTMPESEACLYEKPFAYVREVVKPERDHVRNKAERERWWLHARPVPDVRNAVRRLARFIASPRVSKHRLFAFRDPATLADGQLIVFARDDDYSFGILHSSAHEVWARATGTQLREEESGFRYTPSTCFETFPLPWAPGEEDTASSHYGRIAAAARELNEQRERWLNPPEWIEQVSAKVDAADTFADVPAAARPLVRRSAILAAAAKDPRLKKRTLTNLYNERPQWLKLAHERLDRAVLAAYAATDPAGGWSEDWAAVWLDTGAGQPLPPDHPLAAERQRVDQAVLANVLRLNREGLKG